MNALKFFEKLRNVVSLVITVVNSVPSGVVCYVPAYCVSESQIDIQLAIKIEMFQVCLL